MQNLKWKLSLGAAIICLLYALFAGNNYRKERDLYKHQIENDFKPKYLQYEHKFQIAEHQRRALIDTLNVVNLRTENVQRHSDSVDLELKKVKGRYKNMSSSDKAKELTRRANDAK